MPANNTTSTAAAARASVQGSTLLPQSSGTQHRLNGHRQTEAELARPRGGLGKGDKQRSKAKRETRRERGRIGERCAKDGLADDGDCYGDDVSAN